MAFPGHVSQAYLKLFVELSRTTVAVNLIFFNRKNVARPYGIGAAEFRSRFLNDRTMKFLIFALELREPKGFMDNAFTNRDNIFVPFLF